MKKETMGIIVSVLLVMSVVMGPFGYMVGLSQTKTVASNCGDVVCPECPDVNITTPEVNQTVYWNNITNNYYTNITVNETSYSKSIDLALSHALCYNFPYIVTDSNCAIMPEISINHELKRVAVYIENDPYTVPDSFAINFLFKNTIPFGDNATVITAQIIGQLSEWKVYNITTLEPTYVVYRNQDNISAIAWTYLNGLTWPGQNGILGRLLPGESGTAKLTVYFNETELELLDFGNQMVTIANYLPIVFRANGEIIEVIELGIFLMWYP